MSNFEFVGEIQLPMTKENVYAQARKPVEIATLHALQSQGLSSVDDLQNGKRVSFVGDAIREAQRAVSHEAHTAQLTHLTAYHRSEGRNI